MKKLKIVHVNVIDKYVEGAGYQENLISKKHVELGFDTYLVASQFTIINGKSQLLEVGSYTNNDGVKVAILPKRELSRKKILGWFSPKTIGLYEYLEKIKPDVIFQHGMAEWDILDIIKYKKENPKILIYVDNHRDYYNARVSLKSRLLNLRFRSMHRKLIEYAEKFWGVTPWRVQYLQDIYGVPAEKTDLLVMGADESKIHEDRKEEIRKAIREKYDIPQDAFVVVSGGRLEKRKRIEVLAEAISRFKKEDNVFLLLFGKPVEGYNDLDCYKNVANIRMIGWVQSDDVYGLFLSSDLAVFPATHSVLWEQSVACGLPGVFQRWEGMSHVNVNDNAILLDEVNAGTLYDTIRGLIGSNQYDEMRRSAQDAKEQFYYSKIALRAIGLNE